MSHGFKGFATNVSGAMKSTWCSYGDPRFSWLKRSSQIEKDSYWKPNKSFLKLALH